MAIHITSMSSLSNAGWPTAGPSTASKPTAGAGDFRALFARTAAEGARKIGVAMPTTGKAVASSSAPTTTAAGTSSSSSAPASTSSGTAATTESGSSAPTAQSVFGANPWETGVYGTCSNGVTYGYNSYYFATPATAQIVANMLGGTVVASDAITSAPGSPFMQSQPNLMVQLPNGAQVNAGMVAQIYTHGYPQSTVDQMVAQIAATPAPVSS
jgi:hypothetical protein